MGFEATGAFVSPGFFVVCFVFVFLEVFGMFWESLEVLCFGNVLGNESLSNHSKNTPENTRKQPTLLVVLLVFSGVFSLVFAAET